MPSEAVVIAMAQREVWNLRRTKFRARLWKVLR
jgi:hypothetical protein